MECNLKPRHGKHSHQAQEMANTPTKLPKAGKEMWDWLSSGDLKRRLSCLQLSLRHPVLKTAMLYKTMNFILHLYKIPRSWHFLMDALGIHFIYINYVRYNMPKIQELWLFQDRKSVIFLSLRQASFCVVSILQKTFTEIDEIPVGGFLMAFHSLWFAGFHL